MKRHIFGGICQVLFRKKWGDFNYEQRKSLEKSRLRIPRRYINGGVQYELIAVILPEVLCVSCRVRQTCYAAAEMAVA